MGFFRSEIMKLYQLTASKDDATTIMNAIGAIGKMQFIDLNVDESPLRLPYTNALRAIEDSERKLNYLLEQCRQYNIDVSPPDSIAGFVQQLKQISKNKSKDVNLLNEQIQKDILNEDEFVQKQLEAIQTCQNQASEAADCLKVLQVAKEMLPQLEQQFNQGEQSDRDAPDQQQLLGDQNESSLMSVAGVIDQIECERLRRLIFRATKGKSFIHLQEYMTEEENDEDPKMRSVYIVMFMDGGTLGQRIKKICDSFAGHRFDIPTTGAGFSENINKIETTIKDNKTALLAARSALVSNLKAFDRVDGDVPEEGAARASTIYIYKMFLAKEKALYQNLNCVKWHESTFIGYYWAPMADEVAIDEAIKEKFPTATIMAESKFNIKRPTYFKTNDVTDVYQEIIDTYGVPAYLEANPALLTIVTFPFFFGMMFGDMGHGSILLVVGIIITLFPGLLKGGAFEDILRARYLILLMGIMAFYCGFIYNEWFAIPTNFFGTCYDMNANHGGGEPLTPVAAKETAPDGAIVADTHDEVMVYRRPKANCVYFFGQDPVWSVTSNRIVFSNSIKMKMSVIFGVLHMTFGIIHKGLNAAFFKQYASMFAEVFTGIIILWGLFGWMDILIIAKFFRTVDIDATDEPVQLTDLQISALEREGSASVGDMFKAPQYPNEVINSKFASIIQIMITGIFSPGTCPANQEKDIGDYSPLGNICNLYNIMLILTILVFISIPIMLFTIPCMTLCEKPHEKDEVNQIEMSEREEGQPGVGVKAAINADGDDEAGDANKVENDDEAPNERESKLKGELLELDKQMRGMCEPEGDHSFGEAFIHSMIHTIEFVLGTVSNTASYLRLWALSLAHGQLAEVFFNLVFAQFVNVFAIQNMWLTVLVALILFPVFWSITFAVIMCMDLLECALHCLRLHWVEFQNKFYAGDGYKFKPYSLDNLLNDVLKA